MNQPIQFYSFLTPTIITKFSSDKLMKYPQCQISVNNILQSVNPNDNYNSTTQRQHHEILGMLFGLLTVRINEIEKKQQRIETMNNQVNQLIQIKNNQTNETNQKFNNLILKEYPKYY